MSRPLVGPRVLALTGFSGAGKTTAIVALIGSYLAEGLRVGAIKHTHHPLNEEHRGDTGRFRDAGADPVVLAGRGEAVLFSELAPARTTYEAPRDLLRHFGGCDLVLVEGFKELGDWPQVTIAAGDRPTLPELREIVDRIARSL